MNDERWERVTAALYDPAPLPEGLAERAYQAAVASPASRPAPASFLGLSLRAALAAGVAAAALLVVLQVHRPGASTNPVALTWSLDTAGFEARDPAALIRAGEGQP